MLSPWDFSKREIKEITISVLVLSFVFAYPDVFFNPVFFLYSLLGVGVAFIGHELSHRFVARRLGYYSAYKMWTEGLLLAFIFAIVSGGAFVFAAPGAVVFSSYWVFKKPTMNEIGKIGVAGVVFNLSVSYMSILLFHLTGVGIFRFISTVNAWLAVFNLIPFGPLDGLKVFRWNKRIWISSLIFGIVALVFS
ncbi:MAG: site-2 protease family protein [Candidatus Aenigmarchaeota archaeon]|nr:site-2 protease family protein [Candidatus Aenigmarchaeota archaeon]